MILFVIGIIGLTNLGFKQSYEESVKIAPNTKVNVLIDSSGGRIDVAFVFAERLSKLDATCYVKYAASAAFQVIMPACKRIVFTKNSTLSYHSAGLCIEKQIHAAELLTILREVTIDSAAMAIWMEMNWGPTKCNVEVNAKFPELPTTSCSLPLMFNETGLTAKEFANTFPDSKIPFYLIEENKFPVFPKKVRIKQAVPITASKCEVY